MSTAKTLENQTEGVHDEHEDHNILTFPETPNAENLATMVQAEEPEIEELSGNEPGDGLNQVSTEDSTEVDKETEPPPDIIDYQDTERICQVDPSILKPDPTRPRAMVDPIHKERLKESIQIVGVVTPVVIRVDEEGNVFVVDGWLCVEIAQELGLNTVPSRSIESGRQREFALMLNLLRKNLTTMERAEGLIALKREIGGDNRSLGKRVGLKDSTVSEMLSFANLLEMIREDVRTGRASISRKALIHLAKITDTDEQLRTYQEILSNGGSIPGTKLSKKSVESWKESVARLDLTKYAGDQLTEIKSELQALLTEIQQKLN
jgi:ParB/RepB/Spo0J family partition protein